jgi:membrane-bound ClpP family serine protease
MHHQLTSLIVVLASLAFVAPASAQAPAKPQEVRLAGAAKWTGSVGDRVEVTLREGAVTKQLSGTVKSIDAAKGVVALDLDGSAGATVRQFLASQIVSMKTVGAAPASAPTQGGASPAAPKPATTAAKPSGRKDAQGYDLDENGKRIAPKPGVFLLPWKGGVGQTARNDEIEALAKEVDKWAGPQIIVLDIDSPGGLVLEIFEIVKTLEELKKRHRVVVWVKEAISAAAVTSMQCEEIYFRTEGALGAAMMIQGQDSAYGEQLDQFRDEIGEKVELNGRNRMIFEAMVLADAVLTYTKDPETGEVTWHDKITGLPGEVVLSTTETNLVFNSSNALDSKFCNGIADNTDELAKLLGLPEWYEISDYGVKLANGFLKVCEQCEKDVQLQLRRRGIRRGTQKQQLIVEIEVCEKLLDWSRRCPPCVAGAFGQLRVNKVVEQLREELKEFKKQLSDINKSEN